MRRSKWALPALTMLRLAMAQEDCPAPVTITDLASGSSMPISSNTAAPATTRSLSISRQVITVTQLNTVIMTSNGVKIEKTQAVTNVLLVDSWHTATATSGLVDHRQATSCPPAVTVTLISQQTGSTAGPSSTSFSSTVQTESATTSKASSTSGSNTPTPTSTSSSTQAASSTSSTVTSGVDKTSTTQPSTTASMSESSTGPSLTMSSSSTSHHPSSSSSSPASQSTSESLTSKPSSQSTSLSSSSHSSSSQATGPSSSGSTSSLRSNSPGSASSTGSKIVTSGPPSPTTFPPGLGSESSKDSPPTSSHSPTGSPQPPTGSSTGPPSSTFQSVTVLSEIDPNIWKSPTPTITCKVPCNLDLPCLTLDKPTVVSPPPYTTSLCKQHCDGIDFRTMTTISFPPITALQVCFYPMQAEAEDVFTAAPNWFGGNGGLINITAPASLSTCPPHWPDTDPDGKCGPENHYLCPKKKCCGKDNKCGEGLHYCGEGCQLNWGSYCWKNSTTCKMPKFGQDDDDHDVPIFPIWFDAPDLPGPPPPLNIRNGDITFSPPPDPCAILGCKGICGWISCEGIAGWLIKMFRIPKLKCNIITKTFCRLLKLPCCKKKGNDDSDTECEFCDPPEGSMLNGDGKVCDPNMENCEDLPEEEDEDECTKTSSATDRTVFCAMATAQDGKSSQTCTSTASKMRSGCTIQPESTKTVTSTGCQTTTVEHVSELCQVITGASTTRTECPSTITRPASGCEVSPTKTSVFTTSCDEITATHISELCSVATGANSTSTYCRSTRSSMVSGCDVTASATSVFSTDCFSRTTVTDKTASCFALGSTVVGGSTFIPSTTCTATASSVWSGCELTGSTTSVVSTSFPACQASAQITLEPMPTFASNFTDDTTSSCGPPTSSGLPECTKIVVGQYVVTEAMGEISGSGISARDDGGASTAAMSCYCGPSAGADVWPVTVCDGKSTWCPNEATTTREQTGTPAPPTLPAAPS